MNFIRQYQGSKRTSCIIAVIAGLSHLGKSFAGQADPGFTHVDLQQVCMVSLTRYGSKCPVTSEMTY